MAETLLVVDPQRFVAQQEFVAAQQQFGKVHHPFALALRVIHRVQLDEPAVVVVIDLDRIRPQPGLLGAADELLQAARRILLVIDVVALQQPLDRRQLIGTVEDLERLRQAGVAVMCAQQPVAQAVKGADPHAAHVDRQHRRDARQHLLGGLVGERDRQNALRPDLAGLDQPRDARGQHTCLAGARAREDQRGLTGKRDGSELFGVQ